MMMATPFLKQAFVSAGVLLTMVEVGFYIGGISSLLPALKDPNSDITADLETSSWIVAIQGLALIPGFLSSSFYMDRYGRRTAFMLDIIPGAFSLILMYIATDIYYLIAARFLQGITIGSTMILGAIVIGEYTDPVYRGMFLSLKTAAVYSGSAITHVLGNYFNWRTVSLICLVPNVIIFGIIWMWPESPSWLATKKNFDKSEKNFYWLRGKTEQSSKELKEMLKTIQDGRTSKESGCMNKFRAFYKKIGRKDFVKPVQIYFFAAILVETSGRHIFPSYGVQIISEILGSTSQVSFYYTLSLDILLTLSVILSSVLIKNFKQRTLLFITGGAAFIVLMVTCGYLLLVSLSILSNTSWLPITLLGLYLALVNSACAPISLALIGEIFPLVHKAEGTTVAGLLLSVASIISLKTFPIMSASIKIYGSLFVLGVMMGISLVFLYFMLPETKNRTLQEIEDYFNNGEYKTYELVPKIEEIDHRTM